MNKKENKALIGNSSIGLHQAFKNILNNNFTVKSTMEENNELTAEECFNSTNLAKFKNKKSFRKETMFDFAEHYHEIKSKDLEDTIDIVKQQRNEAEARVQELEDKMRTAINNGYTHWGEAVEEFEQTLKTK